MKILLEHKKKRKKLQFLRAQRDKTRIYSYGAYLQHRKSVPYEISYKSFAQYWQKTRHFPGYQLNNILLIFEHRLDMILYRIRFCRSLAHARQMIFHGKIGVNGNIITTPGFLLKPGDLVLFKENIQSYPFSERQLDTNSGLYFCLTKKYLQSKAQKGLNSRKPRRKKKRNMKRKAGKLKKKPSFLFRPLHMEVNFQTKTAIFLYAPQKLHFYKYLNFDLIRRGFNRTF